MLRRRQKEQRRPRAPLFCERVFYIFHDHCSITDYAIAYGHSQRFRGC